MVMPVWKLWTRLQSHKSRGRHDVEDDAFNLDLVSKPRESIKRILSSLNQTQGLSDHKKLNLLNILVKLLSTININDNNSEVFGFSISDIMCCLTPSLLSDSSDVRAAGLRALRHCIRIPENLTTLVRLRLTILICRSLELLLDNENERLQALRIIRKSCAICPQQFPKAFTHSLSAIAMCSHGPSKDQLHRACVATLCELCLLNPQAFVAGCGLKALRHVLISSELPLKMAECVLGTLLWMLNNPNTRKLVSFDFSQLASYFTDFNPISKSSDKNLVGETAHGTLVSLLRSWIGILYFCDPSNDNSKSGLSSIIHALHVQNSSIRIAIINLLREILGFSPAEWVDDIDTVLESVNPYKYQENYHLNNGYVYIEAMELLPRLNSNRVNLVNLPRSLLVSCLLELKLDEALVEVILTSDSILSIQSTLLLGEFLHLVDTIVPNNKKPVLSDLIAYALEGKPSSICINLNITTEAYDQILCSSEDRLIVHPTKPLQSNKSEVFIGDDLKKNNAMTSISILAKLHKILTQEPNPATISLYHAKNLFGPKMNKLKTGSHKKYLKHKGNQCIMTKECDDFVKESGVLIVKEAVAWKWDPIRSALKTRIKDMNKLDDTNYNLFIQRLIEYFKPSSKMYGDVELRPEVLPLNLFTLAAFDLIDDLLDAPNESGEIFLNSLLTDIYQQLELLSSSNYSYSCYLNPQRLGATLSQHYFLIIGRVSSSERGRYCLDKTKIFPMLLNIAVSTQLYCYVKLIVSCLDYTEDSFPRVLLGRVLSCSQQKSRLYATHYLRALLRFNAHSAENPVITGQWILELLILQINDDNSTIYMAALEALDEACDYKDYLKILIVSKPNILHLGDSGLLVLIRFLSDPAGYKYLSDSGFVTNQLHNWGTHFNLKYVLIVEGELHDQLTLHQRHEDGHYKTRLSGDMSRNKIPCIPQPPHLYSQMVVHDCGYQALIRDIYFRSIIQIVINATQENSINQLHLKAALWAIGHFGSVSQGACYLASNGVIQSICKIATSYQIYSVRATALYALSLISANKSGAKHLRAIGWNVLSRVFLETDFYKITDRRVESNLATTPSDSSHGIVSEWVDDVWDPTIQNRKKWSTLPRSSASWSRYQQLLRSLSESKTIENNEKLQLNKPCSPPDNSIYASYRLRSDSSCTVDSSTSGVSSGESGFGMRHAENYQHQTLSPIPSSSSLSTIPLQKPMTSLSSESTKLSRRNSFGYRTLKMIQKGMSRKSSRSMTMQSHSTATDMFAMLAEHEIDPMSPLIRPKEFRHSFSVNHSPFEFESVSSCSSNKICHHPVKDYFNESFYGGVTLPSDLSTLFSTVEKETETVPTPDCDDSSSCFKPVSTGSEVLSTDDSDTEVAADPLPVRRQRNHNRVLCMLCSVNEHANRPTTRNRKVSSSSLRRCRTETESSYGMGVEGESPILLPWQHNKSSCLHEASGFGTGSNESGASSDISSLAQRSTLADRIIKSHSSLRRDILKLVEQLPNPVLYKTSTQSLLQMKQMYSDLFHDICVYSDVCNLLAEHHYHIQARRYMHELFLDAPFRELFEEPAAIIGRLSPLETSNTDCMSTDEVEKVHGNDSELEVIMEAETENKRRSSEITNDCKSIVSRHRKQAVYDSSNHYL
ncbi:rapamycin-insensitive companion of mTOR [Daktulosphaira vitifoliae]|uniref:rapamycin-insensitive companion of mTOR n=1 Tax=Daktulosphaira vitifoliae TaxID=58002 RepID=UPI0021A9DFA6|nr:rapamycin-insensitive companion of mTOR [Daktulosphaira vitifoliae]